MDRDLYDEERDRTAHKKRHRFVNGSPVLLQSPGGTRSQKKHAAATEQRYRNSPRLVHHRIGQKTVIGILCKAWQNIGGSDNPPMLKLFCRLNVHDRAESCAVIIFSKHSAVAAQL